jgi:hypothetical protein
MRISRTGGARRNRGGIKAAGGEFKHGLNLLTRYVELFNDFLYA